MSQPRRAIELLAPAGTWDVLEAAVAAGADAVYLGGKRFNMRMHRSDANLDDEMLTRAVTYAHSHGVRLYVTVNNLFAERELPAMRSYLEFLSGIQPDALIVQDLGVVQLVRELGLSLPLHASVMMNIHSEQAVSILQSYGINRVIFNRELSLAELAAIGQHTGVELEYFIHGDMCVAQSGQCLYSGILFGQSSNRGRCLKPCRWPYRLVDTATGRPVSPDPGPYKLAFKDMCLYRHLPALIEAGISSFKIEGRMRTADFVARLVKLYRRAIDRYLDDPAGYTVDEEDWADLSTSRIRDFSTCYAFGNPGAAVVDFSGQREPRFFSQAVKEVGIDCRPPAPDKTLAATPVTSRPGLAVKIADLPALSAACSSGADIIYIGGESFLPAKPWTPDQMAEAVAIARQHGAAVFVNTPRITADKHNSELVELLAALAEIKPAGLMVSNIGALNLARRYSTLPIVADFSLNLFNSSALRWLRENGVVKATVSLEATGIQGVDLARAGVLPVEVVVHGALTAMVMDYCIPRAVIAADTAAPCPGYCDSSYSLLDTAEQYHPIATDQHCRNHLLFAKDLCLLPYLSELAAAGVASFRVEGQHYSPAYLGRLTAAYRQELDAIYASGACYSFDPDRLAGVVEGAPRPLGIGVFRYKASR